MKGAGETKRPNHLLNRVNSTIYSLTYLKHNLLFRCLIKSNVIYINYSNLVKVSLS